MLLTPGNQPDGSSTWTPGYTSQGGVCLELNVTQSIPTGSGTNTALVWHATAIWDPDVIWTGGASGTFTVPAGWTHCRVIGNVRFAFNASGSRQHRITKNGAYVAIQGGAHQSNPDSASPARMNIRSGVFDVTSGDTIQLTVSQTSGVALNVEKGVSTWIAILRWDQPNITTMDTLTSAAIADGTNYSPTFDSSRQVYHPDTLGYRNFDTDDQALLPPAGGGLYRFYAGARLDPIDNDLLFSFTHGGSGQFVLGTAYPKQHMEYDVGAYQCTVNLASGPVQFPSDALGDAPFQQRLGLWLKHGDTSTTNLLDAYIQVERADDAFCCILESSANQNVSTSTVTTINYDTIKYEVAPGGFRTGAGTGELIVPAVPGGGSWDYAILTMTKTGSVEFGDKYVGFQVDTGGGFGSWTGGQADTVQQASEDGEPSVHLVGFYPTPSAGDKFRCFWWQGSGFTESIDGAGAGENADHFSIELFKV